MYYIEQLSVQESLSLAKTNLKKIMPDNPAVCGWASFAQCDEDGIIRECLRRIDKVSPCSKTFIEMGCADGLENNTHQLLLDGFSGVWIEGDESKTKYLESELGGLRFKRLLIKHCFIDRTNIVALLQGALEFIGESQLDFFSLDVDGNDLHLAKLVLTTCSPKLVCVEYNAKFPPPTLLTMDYNPKHAWGGDDYFGATLQSWVEELADYSLVCCNLSGVNAFFVRKNLASVFTAYEIDDLYQPARYWLANGAPGHKNTLKWLKQALRD